MRKIKLSIFEKYFFITAALILLTVILSVFINTLFLNRYYLAKEKKKMIKTADILYSIKDEDEYSEMKENLAVKENYQISEIEIKKRGLSMHRMHMRLGRQQMMRHNFIYGAFSSDFLEKMKIGEYSIKNYFNKIILNNELILIIKKDKDTILSVAKPISSLNEASQSANELFMISALIVMFIAMLISFAFTKKITKPIKLLIDKSKKMADFNFEERINLETGDELEELGNALNYLNSQLSINISKIKSISESLEHELYIKNEMEEKRKEFIADISHELKTPLALQRAYAEGLIEGIADKGETEYYSNVILEENIKMDNLVKKLLELSKVQSIDDGLDETEFDIKEIVNSVVDNFRYYMKKNEISLRNNVKDSVIIVADYNKIKMVIENFVSNAIKYSKKGSIIRIEIKNDVLGVFNSDSFVPEYERMNIWEPFYKIDKSRQRDGSTGLGLAIVKEILEKHGFTYGLREGEYKGARGTEFYFSISKKS